MSDLGEDVKSERSESSTDLFAEVDLIASTGRRGIAASLANVSVNTPAGKRSVLDVQSALSDLESRVPEARAKVYASESLLRDLSAWQTEMNAAQAALHEVDIVKRQTRSLLQELESPPRRTDSLNAVLPKLRTHSARIWGPATKNLDQISSSGSVRDIFVTNVVGDLLAGVVNCPLKFLLTDRLFDLAAVDWAGHEQVIGCRVYVYSNVGTYVVAVATEDAREEVALAAPASTSPDSCMIRDFGGESDKTRILHSNTSFEDHKSPEVIEAQTSLDEMESYMRTVQQLYESLRKKVGPVIEKYRKFGGSAQRLRGAFLLHTMLTKSNPRAAPFDTWKDLEHVLAVASQMSRALTANIDKPGVKEKYDEFQELIEGNFKDVPAFEKMLEK